MYGGITMSTPVRPLAREDIMLLNRAMLPITQHYTGINQSIPYRFNPNDPRHVKMYFRGCNDNAYFPVLLFIYRYGSDTEDWSPVMVYLNPRNEDILWLHGITRLKKPDSAYPEYMYSLYRGIYVSEPNFGDVIGYNEQCQINFLDLVKQIGDKQQLEDLTMSLILGQLCRAETCMNTDAAKVFNEKLLCGPKRSFNLYTFDMTSYPATIFLKKYTQLLIRCAEETQPITHKFRNLPWIKEDK